MAKRRAECLRVGDAVFALGANDKYQLGNVVSIGIVSPRLMVVLSMEEDGVRYMVTLDLEATDRVRVMPVVEITVDRK